MKIIQIIKKSKLFYYLKNIFQALLPKNFYQKRLNKWLSLTDFYSKKLIETRLDYYINLEKHPLSNINSIKIGDIKKPKKGSVYFFDLIKITRYFNNKYRISYKFGDITDLQITPTFVKSRPIKNNNLSVLLKLNEVRHFNFVHDTIPFSDKKNIAIWRGVIHKENRRKLVRDFYDHPLCDVGQIGELNLNPIWIKPFMSIKEQLKFKFILSIEGVDVATNLKWIMSSNSLCLMPTPKYETWYMEGKLIPNFHYIHLKNDYSDLIEKVNYYSNPKNEDEALTVIKNANAWVQQFKDPKFEKLLSILVVNKYLKVTEQL